ncbi:MAG: YgiQ family radical SAM protein [Treponema sp.]|jgi:uncharacterized radical SAM protein YgiQ|nr:YgiQ family radical SAM protein [Treponema sp.]
MKYDKHRFLPLSRQDMKERGWESCEFIFVSGDAYVDHPSFAAAVISRVLEAAGFTVGIIPQPDWKNPESYTVLGRPRFGFLVGSGCMDSMVAHYTSGKKPRSNDEYSPGGKAGLRPDRAILKYVEGIRGVYKDVPVIIGGIEASLRRFAHYDYWSDKVRRSILLDSKADILVFGMGEDPIISIAERLRAGESIGSITDVRGTSVRAHGKIPSGIGPYIELPSFDVLKGADEKSLRNYADHFMLQKHNQDPESAKILVEKSDERFVIQNLPSYPLAQADMDKLYELPFTRMAHPQYDADGGIPALKEVQFSLVSSRGCFGGCSFCAITAHQGKAVTGRSCDSVVREARELINLEGFKGYIHDLGGPTANFSGPACERQSRGSFCSNKECLFPDICPQMKVSHKHYLKLLDAVRTIPGIKKVFIRSGIRFDYLLADKDLGGRFMEHLCKYHVSGQLKTAPEHISDNVLNAMGKCGNASYEEFRKKYADTNQRLGMKQYIIPYFISSHPGSTLNDAIELALYMKRTRFIPDQVQDFYPTPGTLATCMYHTGLDPRTMKPIYVPKGEREKRMQRALLQFNRKESRLLVKEALEKTGRTNLIGRGSDCLIPF